MCSLGLQYLQFTSQAVEDAVDALPHPPAISITVDGFMWPQHMRKDVTGDAINAAIIDVVEGCISVWQPTVPLQHPTR